MDHHYPSPPVDDWRTAAALRRRSLLLHQTRPPQVDDETRNEPTPEPTGSVRHLVASTDAVDGVRHHSEVVVWRLASGERCSYGAALRYLNDLSVDGLGFGSRGVCEVYSWAFHREHAGNEPLVVAERKSNFEPLQKLEILREILAGEPTAVMEDEGNV